MPGDGLHQQQIVFVVRVRLIALDRQHAHHPIADQQRHRDRSLRQSLSRGRVLQLNARALLGPLADQARLARADDLAEKAVAERKGAARQLDTRLHLANNLHHTADVVIQTENEAAGIQHLCQRAVQGVKEAFDIGRVGDRLLNGLHRREARVSTGSLDGRWHAAPRPLR